MTFKYDKNHYRGNRIPPSEEEDTPSHTSPPSWPPTTRPLPTALFCELALCSAYRSQKNVLLQNKLCCDNRHIDLDVPVVDTHLCSVEFTELCTRNNQAIVTLYCILRWISAFNYCQYNPVVLVVCLFV